MTTRNDLLTWLHNTNPHNLCMDPDDCSERIADAIQQADHPPWGASWEEWLDANIDEIADAVAEAQE